MKKLTLSCVTGFALVVCGGLFTDSISKIGRAVGAMVPTIRVGDPPKANYTPPAIDVDGPSKPVKRGHNVIFGVKPLGGPVSDGLVQTKYAWIVHPSVDDLFSLPDNSRASFGSGVKGDPTSYEIQLLANYVFVDSDGKNPVLISTLTTKTIQIDDGGNAPVDPSKPDPNKPVVPVVPVVPVDPVLPNGQFGLAQFTFNTVNVAGVSGADAGKLAGSFRAIIARNAGAPFASPADLGAATIASHKLALGDHLNAWAGILDTLAQKTNDLKVGSNVIQMLTAWDEIATGLEAYQKAHP